MYIYRRTCDHRSQCLLRKMYVLITFVLLVTCNLSTPIGIRNRETSKLLADSYSGQFFQSIREWLNNVTHQIEQRLFGQTFMTTSPSLPTEILNVDKFELQRKLRNGEWHLLDLSALSFDPEQDWGFRVGNWYFIRKESKDQSRFKNNPDRPGFQLTSTIQPKNSAEIQTEGTFDMNDPGSTSTMTILTLRNMTSLITQPNDSQTTIQPTERIDLAVNSEMDKRLENKADNDFHKGSVEVLME